MRRGRRPVTVAILLALCAIAPTALAASGGHGFQLNEHGFYIVDFVVMVAALWWFARKPARRFLEQRHEAAKAEMEEAMRLRAASQERFDRYEALLKGLDREIEAIRDQFRRDGEAQRGRIIEAARKEGERIRRDAETQLRRETAMLRQEIEREIIHTTLGLAEQRLRDRMTPEAHRGMVRDFVADLESRSDLTSRPA